MSSFHISRRRVLRALAAAAAATAVSRATGDHAQPKSDVCANGSLFEQPLALPGRDGWMGYCDASAPLTLRATMQSGGRAPLAFVATRDGRTWRNPTLTADAGAGVRIALANAIDEPTIIHWHGLAVDTRNDGNGETVAAPGRSYDYAFTVRNRAAMYWYHPHPHGMTAGQAQRGLFGLWFINDDDERELARALDAVPGATELPLVLHDRRAAARDRYAPSPADLVHGYFGDEMLVNGTFRPYHDAAARGYRLRIVNAANARTFLLAFRRDDGSLMPFTLLGTDGGLLARPVPCREVFVASAERVDLWVDFSALAIGDFVVLESLAFDPMHMEASAGTAASGAASGGHDHQHNHGGDAAAATIADGARLSLLQFRIRERAARSPAPPASLSRLPAAVAPTGDARPLRLGFAKGRWRINDRVYDMAETPIVVARNTVETWLLRNYHTSMPHAMHLHGFAFRVLARETSPPFLAPLAVDERGRLATDLGVKDTVLVWPGESVRIAIDFACPFPGEQIYMLHCHNLEHEDGGMMLRVKVA